MTAAADTQSATRAPTWRQKVHAWWEGYELVDAAAAGSQDSTPGKVAKPSAPAGPSVASRAKVAEALWGFGFTTPGDAEYVSNLIRPLGLDPSITTMVLGVEQGGAIRVIVQEKKAWVEGADSDQAQIDLAKAHAEAAKPGENARFVKFNPARPKFKANRYGALFSKSWLHRAGNKPALLRAVWESLRPGAQVLITDYVLQQPGSPGPATAAWYAAEGVPIEPWQQQRLKAALEALPLDVRIAEDNTPIVRELIAQAFVRLQETLPALQLDADGMRAVRDAIHLWNARLQALASGEVAVYRFVAQKPHPVA
ncbi:MAG: hypothetical protein EXQ96_03230 [Alphaproteobacteria bacterium]|nr:hypothetical protein [Alphaproteobacteria bacterium]